MATRRLHVLLAIPEPLTPAQEKAWTTALTGLKILKAGAVEINKGQPNVEHTVQADWHVCNHDEKGDAPDGKVQEI